MGLLCVIIFSIFLASSSTEAYNFIVGGKNGWSSHPSEDYTQWSGRLRFSVNDTLSFKYPKETDSVVVVSKDDYDKCNAAKPILKLDGGDSTFKFDRSGPFYFITSNKTNCDQGQKLLVVVLALRNKSPPAPVPSPESQAPGPSPPASSPAPASLAPAPASLAPVPSPESQAPSPSPSTESPAVSPAPATGGPAVSPAPGTPSALSPGSTPSDVSSPPAPSKSFAPAVSPAGVVSVVLSVTVAAFITFT